VIVDSRRFCESARTPARPAVGEVCVGLCYSAYMPSQFRLSVCHTDGSVKSPVNIVSSDIRVMQIFAGFRRYGASNKKVVV